MTTITRTFSYRSEYGSANDFHGWEIQELPGFDAISIDKGQYNNVERWSSVLTHDAIEHDPNIAPGTIANELAAFGAVWIGRVENDCTVTHDGLKINCGNMLEILDDHFYDFDSTSEHDDLMTELDDHIGLPDGDYVIDDYMREIITPWIESHSCDYFTAGDLFCSKLIERCLGWMQIGADTFTDRFKGSENGDIFERIRYQIGDILSSPERVLEAIGYDDQALYMDEFWEDFTVILTIDVDSLEVTAAVDSGTAYELDQMVPEDEDEDD
jgi:hypothetical protein